MHEARPKWLIQQSYGLKHLIQCVKTKDRLWDVEEVTISWVDMICGPQDSVMFLSTLCKPSQLEAVFTLQICKRDVSGKIHNLALQHLEIN